MDSRLSLLLAIACFAAAAQAADLVPVSIYFESLCSRSQKFIREQFTSGYDKLKDAIQPDFVPYGKRDAANKTCQHGPLECEGNKILGCAIHKINATNELVTFVNCIMSVNVSTNATSFPVDQCAKEAGSNLNNIVSCANSTEGGTYDDSYGQRTAQMFPSGNFSVPYVVLNNTTNDELSHNLTTNFVQTMCSSFLKDRNLDACKSSASTLVASLIPAILALFIARI